MKKITRDAINAFEQGTPFSRSNTTVTVKPNVTVLSLHGNEIAYRYNDPEKTLMITNAGWQTNTTKERLNGISGVNIRQRNFKWFLNDKPWDGSLIEVK